MMQVGKWFTVYPNILTSEKIAVIILNLKQCGFNVQYSDAKDAEGMSNSVDPDLDLRCMPIAQCYLSKKFCYFTFLTIIFKLKIKRFISVFKFWAKSL